MNGINLIDGLDGLASGVTLTAMGPLFLIASADGAMPPILLPWRRGPAGSSASSGSICIRRRSSWATPVRCCLASCWPRPESASTQSGPPGAPFWVPVVALGLALADAAWAILRRLDAGLPIFAPDKRQVHHQLFTAGLSERSAMVLLWLVSAGLGVAAYSLLASRGVRQRHCPCTSHPEPGQTDPASRS